MSGKIGSAGANSGKLGQTELDYEEGTWTATWRFGGEGGSVEATYSTAPYTKVGGICHIEFNLTLGSSNVGSGHMNPGVIGLPFTVRRAGVAFIAKFNDKIDARQVTARFQTNEKFMVFYIHPTSTSTNLSTMTNAHFAASGVGRSIGGSGWYYCDN